ncbi:MAG: rRNA pseudouridine synthase [Anaerolineae bacterium]|nr:rRNA pseudouridine synthase [Anaerolineae bacterium]
MNHDFRYVVAYKPFGVLCAPRDRLNRPNLTTLGIPPTLKPAGRLDRDSEGLVIATDDGLLIHRLTHPQYRHPKTYLVQVLGMPTLETLNHLRAGVEIKFGRTQPADVELLTAIPALPPFPNPLPAPDKTSYLRIILYEGMNRQIKRMTAAVGHPTVRLMRVAIGALKLPSTFHPGQWRDLTPIERGLILESVGLRSSRF